MTPGQRSAIATIMLAEAAGRRVQLKLLIRALEEFLTTWAEREPGLLTSAEWEPYERMMQAVCDAGRPFEEVAWLQGGDPSSIEAKCRIYLRWLISNTNGGERL